MQNGEQKNPKLFDYAAQYQQQQQVSGSLPNDSSPLAQGAVGGERSNSEMGQYPDLATPTRQYPEVATPTRQHPEVSTPNKLHRTGQSPEDKLRPRPSPQNAQHPSPTSDRPETPENKKPTISGPTNGQPLPAGWEKSASSTPSKPAVDDDKKEKERESRREKVKSRGFWGFAGRVEKPSASTMPQVSAYHSSRPVFGVPLEEALQVRYTLQALVLLVADARSLGLGDRVSAHRRLSMHSVSRS